VYRPSIIHKLGLLFFFVVASHWLGNKNLPGKSDSDLRKKWKQFALQYRIDEGFGIDGNFVRAGKNGHGLIYKTYDYAWRFTRKTASDKNNNCGSCHTAKAIALSFVNSDRYDPAIKKRTSFEEKVMRCYVKNMDGFVPTIYDPAIRDIRIFARLVAHHLKLVEGTLAQTVIPENDESINPEYITTEESNSRPDNSNSAILDKAEDSQSTPANTGESPDFSEFNRLRKPGRSQATPTDPSESPGASRPSNTLTTSKKSPKSTAKKSKKRKAKYKPRTKKSKKRKSKYKPRTKKSKKRKSKYKPRTKKNKARQKKTRRRKK